MARRCHSPSTSAGKTNPWVPKLENTNEEPLKHDTFLLKNGRFWALVKFLEERKGLHFILIITVTIVITVIIIIIITVVTLTAGVAAVYTRSLRNCVSLHLLTFYYLYRIYAEFKFSPKKETNFSITFYHPTPTQQPFDIRARKVILQTLGINLLTCHFSYHSSKQLSTKLNVIQSIE